PTSSTLDFAVPCPNICQSVNPFLGSPARVSILALLFSCATRLTLSATNGDPYSAPTSADITDEFHVVSTSRTYFPSSTLKCYYTFLSFSGSRMWIIDVHIRPSKRPRAEQRFIVRTPPSLFSLFLRATLKVLACASRLFLLPVRLRTLYLEWYPRLFCNVAVEMK
ncbi:hypothetical protein BC827DRAFT_1239433, partial [Russula dissimulans]